MTVYLDTNKNGKLDQGEESVITDSSGHYAFNDLVPGTYTVSIVANPQVAYNQTLPRVTAHVHGDDHHRWSTR